MALPAIRYPDPPAHIEPYCDVLGPELTIRFLLRFGGAQLYLAENPCGRSDVERLVGAENLKRLAARANTLSKRIPLANVWLAAALAAEGKSAAEIARTLRSTDVTVRRWLRRAEERIAQGKRV